MKKTEKLGLNILDGTDPISVESFNQNAQLLDAEVSGKCSMTHGQWVGDGTENRKLSFPRKPLLVLIRNRFGICLCFHGALYAFQLNYTYSQLNTRSITWDEESCALTLHDSAYFNGKNESYSYIAFLEN